MKKMLLVLICCLFATGAYAETKPFQLSLVPDVALQSQTTYIKGVSLNIWGENQQTGFALGFVNGSTGDSVGFSWGFLGNYAENYKGLQLGLVNYTSAKMTGAQLGFVNYTADQMTGFQWGFVNGAEKLHGLQLGLVNYAATADGALQVGLVNIMKETKAWFTEFPEEVTPVMVLVNWRF